MSRLADIREQDATGKAADIFAGIKSDGQSAECLRPSAATRRPRCSRRWRTTRCYIKAASAPNSWKPLTCRSAKPPAVTTARRTYADGEKAGFSSEQIHALRRGEYAEEAQLDALVKFAQTLVTTTGTLPEADVAALRNAGFSDQQVIEIISAISAILFTNMVNRVNDTVVDFPKAD